MVERGWSVEHPTEERGAQNQSYRLESKPPAIVSEIITNMYCELQTLWFTWENSEWVHPSGKYPGQSWTQGKSPPVLVCVWNTDQPWGWRHHGWEQHQDLWAGHSWWIVGGIEWQRRWKDRTELWWVHQQQQSDGWTFSCKGQWRSGTGGGRWREKLATTSLESNSGVLNGQITLCALNFLPKHQTQIFTYLRSCKCPDEVFLK